MISLVNVSKQYGSLTAVNNVSFKVDKGECFALLGPNGAGKTTIVKMLLDFTSPSSGTVTVNGLPCSNIESRRGIGYLAENHRIPGHLTGWQYLMRCADYLGITGDAASEEGRQIIQTVGMAGKEHVRTGTYSKGMVQRIGLGACLLGSPTLLLLDEPTSGLDPIGIREIRTILEQLKKRGLTILLNSHLLSEVEKVCDTAAIINKGQLLVKDRISEIVGDNETLEDVFVRQVQAHS